MDIQKKLKASLWKKHQQRNGEQYEDDTLPIRVSIYYCEQEDYDDFLKFYQHDFRFIDKSHCGINGTPTVSISKTFSCNGQHVDSKKTTLTVGVSGIGKTTAVQRCTLDWVQMKNYLAVDLLFPLAFWELNLLRGKKMSLLELLCTFYPELNGTDLSSLDKYSIWFILDGLDGSNLHLDFSSTVVRDVTEVACVECLVTNLISGNLLPSAHIWVTTRPKAAKCIPPEFLLKIAEVEGFSDDQIGEFFTKKFGDEDLANRVFDHVKMSKSLYFLCRIPSLCSIMASGLKNHVLEADSEFTINPITLTEIYKNMMESQVTNGCERMVAKLEELALAQQEKSQMYERDLRDCGLCLKDASMFAKQCPLVLKEERGLHDIPVYHFGHPSIQEYLIASSILKRIQHKLQKPSDQVELYLSCQSLVDEAYQSENGHFDLILRFIFGLLKESGLMDPENPLIEYTYKKILGNVLSSSSVTLIHCLREFDVLTPCSAVQLSFKTDMPSSKTHTSPDSRLLSGILENMNGCQNTFKMDVATSNDEELLRHLPALLKSTTAMLRFCNLTEKCCPALVSVLGSKVSPMTELDLGYNTIGDSGMEKLGYGMQHSYCKLKILRLQGCGLTAHACISLGLILKTSSELRELDLGGNKIGDKGMEKLANGLGSASCLLDSLKLSQCNIKRVGCRFLALGLKQKSHPLRDLNLSLNAINDAGAKELFTKTNMLRLQKLEMCRCNLTAVSCDHIAKALQSESSSLVELNLRNNDLKDSGVKTLATALMSCRLEKLNLSSCGITEEGASFLGGILSIISRLYTKKVPGVGLVDLDLSKNSIKDKGVEDIADGLKNPYGRLVVLNLSHCNLTDRCCTALSSVLAYDKGVLSELDLSCNDLQDEGLRKLSVGLGSGSCRLNKLFLTCCGLSSKCVPYLADALRSNTTNISELLLVGNNLGGSSVRLLVELLKDSKCKLSALGVLNGKWTAL